jgi:protoheme IX farnesyltransferase
MTSWLYLVAISLLDLVFLGYAIALVRNYSDALARRTFRYSILYLTLLFAALFADRLIMF